MGIPDRPGLRERRRALEVLLRALEDCDTVVALSRHAAQAFRYWLGYEARVIAPGVNLHAFRPARARAQQPTIVCSAAAEEPRKHVALLVRAFGLVRREHPQARLVLSRPRERSAIHELGIDARAPGVEWVDLDDREVLARAYGEAWVATLPSECEAFGLVLAEALACGTPIAGYADGAIPELIDERGMGRLFDRLEARSLATALLEALELADEAGTAPRCRARAQEFSSETCAARYLELYRELAASS